MEVSLNAETLAKPWCRALLGVILVVTGIVCLVGQNWYSGITRESCTEVETSLYELRVESDMENSSVVRSIWLIFEDYEESLNIHKSCITSELTSALIELERGTEMKVLHSDKNSNIYELWVEDEKWLDFDTAKKKIDENITVLKYVGYVLLPVGAVFFITAFIKTGKNKKDNSANN